MMKTFLMGKVMSLGTTSHRYSKELEEREVEGQKKRGDSDRHGEDLR